MNQGKIVEYIDQSRFVCAICLQDKGNKLHILTNGNREANISPKRVFLFSRSPLDISRPREELLERLRQEELERDTLKKQVNVKELWELIKDEDEIFDHEYLAQLVFGQDITDAHLSGLVRALFEDRLFFKFKDGHFFPNPPERVDQIIKQRQEEELREERLAKGAHWISEILKGRECDPPDCKDYLVWLLTDIVLFGKEAKEFKYGKDLLERAGTSTAYAKDILIRIGEWEEDENIDLLRLGFTDSFNERVMREAGELKRKPLPSKGREDLRDLFTVTIDSAETRDFDDAVSLECMDGGYRLYVHIADVAEVIEVDSSLEREAKTRAQTLYLPRKHIPMLPPELSEDLLSLVENKDRIALTLWVDMDKDLNIMDYGFKETVINVDRRMTYDEVDKALSGQETGENDKFIEDMYRIATFLRQKREEAGALNLSLPDLQVRFDRDRKNLSLELVPQDTPARMIIAELMILHNCLAGRFSRDNNIPSLFRTQAKPSELIPMDDSRGHIFYVFQQRRKLSPLHIKTTSGPHWVLGLDSYVQVSSPLRRVLDIVAQRQIKGFLKDGEPVYRDHELDEIRLATAPIIKAGQALKWRRQRYWTLKFLREQKGQKYEAIVLNELRNRYRVVLTDFLQVAEVKREDGVLLNPGDLITVSVKKADPWEDILVLEHSGD